MDLQSIACNNCGAPLAVPESANYVTCNHCGSQLAIKRDLDVTYTEKIQQLDERTEEMQGQLEQLRIDSDLNRLERDWEREKQNYMVADKHGRRSIPTTTGSVVGGIFMVIFGIFWTAMAVKMAGGGSAAGHGLFAIFPVFGILFIIAGIGMSVYSFSKASSYVQAERRFRQRRAKVINRRSDPENFA